MRDEYDFSDARRENPYAEKINNNGYVIVVNCGAAQDNSSNSNEGMPSVDSVAEYKTEYKRITN
jgi:hypothetical protein